MKKVETIYNSIEKVIEISKRDGIPTYVAADRMAEERIERIRNSRSQFLQNGHNILSRRRTR